MMVFPFLRFPVRRRLRVFEVWISRRRVGLGTKAPGEALLRKCINPLRYFHPEAAKYRGLSEGSARRMRLLRQLTPKEFVIASPARTLVVAIRSPHAWGRIPTSAFSGLLGMTEFHRRGQPGLQLPCAGKPRRGLPAASLGSEGSFVRAWGLREKCISANSRFFKNLKTGACHFSRNRLYCVQGKKKSGCFPPVAAGDLETVVFYVRCFFPGPAALCGAIIRHPSFL